MPRTNSKIKQNRTQIGQQAAIAVLLAGGTHQQAAEVAGVARSTISLWVKDPAIRSQLEVASAEAVDAARKHLRASAPKAVRVLVEALDDDDIDARLKAADMLLRRMKEFGSQFSVEVSSAVPSNLDELIEERARIKKALGKG